MNLDIQRLYAHKKTKQNYLKMYHRGEVKHKTIKLVEARIGENSDNQGFGNYFLDYSIKGTNPWKKQLINRLS